MTKINLAIVGATGMIGRTFLKVLEERQFPINNLYLFASSRSKGQKIVFDEKEYIVQELNEKSFNNEIDIALFSAGGDISKKYAPIARDQGVIVVDNSSAWRMEKYVPLVVPEVNPEDIQWHKGIISNPNCSTIQCVVALKPLHQLFKIKRIVYSTYQAVSGSGIGGVKDLENGLNSLRPKKYPHPIAFNCLPHIDDFMADGYTKEEKKMINETKKILNDYDLKITATCVRVPVKYGHSVSINLEFQKPFDISQVYSAFNNAKGIIVQDDISRSIYPTPLSTEGTDEVYVGRIRRDFSVKNGLNLWVVSDNTRKGAATNTVQIAELLLKNYNV